MGSDKQFETGLEAFIAGCKIPKDKAEKFRIALRTARKTFQAWGTNISQTKLCADIQDALTVQLGSKIQEYTSRKISKPVMSDTAIKQLLRGKYGKKNVDITGYFLEIYQ